MRLEMNMSQKPPARRKLQANLTEEGYRLLQELATKNGLTITTAIEMLVREKSREKITYVEREKSE